MIRKLLLTAFLLLAPSFAWAQTGCSGAFPPGTVCGNAGATTNIPRAVSAASFSSSGLSITRLQIPTKSNLPATFQTSGYRTANDLGQSCTYTSLGASSTGLMAIQASDGVWFNLTTTNDQYSVGCFGAYADGGHSITSGDIAANPAWRGTYVVGTTWDTVAIQEATYGALATNSTPGVIVWNSSPAANYGLNREIYIPCEVGANGYYTINKPMTLVASQFTITSCKNAMIKWGGDPTVSMWTWNAGSYGLITNLRIGSQVSADYNQGAPVLNLNYTGANVGLATQNLTFISPFVDTSSIFNGRGISVSLAGGSAQGSTITFLNGEFVGFAGDYAIGVFGANAFNVVCENCDIQGFTHDSVQNKAGTVYIKDTSFENFSTYYGFIPVLSQFTTFGADIHSYNALAPQNSSRAEGIRSESDVGMICDSYCVADQVGTVQASSFTWRTGGIYPIGQTLFAQPGCTTDCPGTKYHTFMVVEDSGNGANVWATTTAGSTTTVLQDSAASYSVNQWAGRTLWFRYANGFTEGHVISSNTATSLTLATPTGALPNNTNQYHIMGMTGVSKPDFDLIPQGYSTTFAPGSNQNFTTTANSPVIGVGSSILSGSSAIQVNDYIVIPNADCIGTGPVLQQALIAKVTAINLGLLQITVNKNACYSLPDIYGYWGTPSSADGDLKYIDLDFNSYTGIQAGRGFYPAGGRQLRMAGYMDYKNVRLDWQRTSEPRGTARAGTGGYGDPPSDWFVNGPLLRVNLDIIPAATIDLTSYLQTQDYLTFTPTSDTTLNASALTASSGRRMVLFITTSGTSSYNITFGTNFNSPSGALATGVTSGAMYTLVFEWNGFKWNEVSRAGPGISTVLSQTVPSVPKSASYSQTTADCGKSIDVTTGAPDVTITILSAAGAPACIQYIQKVDSGAGKVIVWDGSTTYRWLSSQNDAVKMRSSGSVWSVQEQLIGPRIDSYLANGSYTWTKPPGAMYEDIVVVGATGGAGSGACVASGTNASGGSGSPGPGLSFKYGDPASTYGSTEAVVVAAKGTGGAAVSCFGNTAGNDGSAPSGVTSFSSSTNLLEVTNVTALGATPIGKGGSVNAATASLNGALARTSGPAFIATVNGGSATSTITFTTFNPPGGMGSGQNSTPANFNGGDSGLSQPFGMTAGAGGVGSSKTAATTGTGPLFDFGFRMGGGGGGGWANADGTAGDGANGAGCGGPGGGGGASIVGSASGKGGDGSDGCVWVRTRF